MNKSKELTQIYAELSQQTTDLVNFYHQILQENLSPDQVRRQSVDVKQIATAEAKAVLEFFQNPEQAKARQRGAELCQADLDEEIVD